MTTPKQVKDAYAQGKLAEASNALPTVKAECPDRYDNKPELRKAWYNGYYTSYILRRHKTLFDKYGIKYP